VPFLQSCFEPSRDNLPLSRTEKAPNISSQPAPEKLSIEQEVKQLAEELSELTKAHAKALNDSIFIALTPEQRVYFERRRERINELCALIGTLKIK